MKLLSSLIRRLPATTVYAHCDLPCGVYDPAQAKIEAIGVYAITKKYLENSDPEFRTRALMLKEQRAELVKQHLWILWTDYFKPEHLEKFPNLHELIWKTTKLAGETKHKIDEETALKLMTAIDEIAVIFEKTRKA